MQRTLSFRLGLMGELITLQRRSKLKHSHENRDSNTVHMDADEYSCGNKTEVLILESRYVAFLTGLAHLTLPNTTISPTTEAWVQGGKYGLILAVDTTGVSDSGHITDYPSDADTVAMQIPLKEGVIPKHTVLYAGPCQWTELIGL